MLSASLYELLNKYSVYIVRDIYTDYKLVEQCVCNRPRNEQLLLHSDFTVKFKLSNQSKWP